MLQMDALLCCSMLSASCSEREYDTLHNLADFQRDSVKNSQRATCGSTFAKQSLYIAFCYKGCYAEFAMTVSNDMKNL